MVNKKIKARVLPLGWEKWKLNTKAQTSSGSTPLSSKDEYYQGGTIPWINSGELSENEIIEPKNFITELGYKNSSTKIFPIDTILIAMYGATVGKTSILKIPACTNQAVCTILPSSNFYSPYLKYYFENLSKYLISLSSGSARDNISQEIIKNHVVFSPSSIYEQKKLVKILEKIDKKIAINRDINRNLEALARQLYDYWFVQFDFPDENGKPYKSSGGKMVYNEKLKHAIPEGWEVRHIKDITEVLLGGTPDTSNEDFWNGSISWLNSGEVAEFPILISEKTITEIGLSQSATVLAPKGSVTLSITRHLRPSILAIDACINQSVVAIKETNLLHSSFLYPYLLNEIPQLMALRTGAQQPHINKETVEESYILLSTPTILRLYYAKAESIYKSIILNAKEIQSLIKQRNELLPLLMNGQVSVKPTELNCDLSLD